MPTASPACLRARSRPQQFVKRLRGFWWKGFQTSRFRGMYRFVDRDRFDAAVARFESEHGDDLEEACRNLFYDLLWFRTEGEGDRGLVEQSTDNVAAAPTLARLFPEARFVHVVRDGRDASASRVSQTRGLVPPRTRVQGIAWWEERIRAIESGADAIPEGHLLTVGLDELVRMQRARAALRPLFRYLGTTMTKRTRRFFSQPNDHRGGKQGALARGDLASARPPRSSSSTWTLLRGWRPTACAARRCCATPTSARDDTQDPLIYVYDRGPDG